MISPLKLLTLLATLAVLLPPCTLVLQGDASLEPSLYSEVDNVQMLNNSTFEKTLVYPSRAKLVQFMNIFCGHCRRFAPTFKKIAAKLYQWKRLLGVYAIDCALEGNVQYCRDFEIKHTPTLRLYSSNYKQTQRTEGIGFTLNTIKPDEIYKQLADYLSKLKFEDRGQPTFELIGQADNAETVWRRHRYPSSKMATIVLVYQPKNSTIGRDTLLELLAWENVDVRILDNRNLFANFGLDPNDQKLAIINSRGNVIPLDPEHDTTDAYVDSIARTMMKVGFTERPKLSTTLAPNEKFVLSPETKLHLEEVLSSRPTIYRADLQQAIGKLLHIEMPKKSLLKDSSLTTLHRFLNLLALHNPFFYMEGQFFHMLNRSIPNTNQLSGKEFQASLKEVETRFPEVFSHKQFIGCIATRPFLRGFSCSLWTLFHYFTVQDALPPFYSEPGDVLRVIQSMIKNFFGCSDCVNHFMEMAKRRGIELVHNRDEAILWLWEAHNEVNQRLAGDATEDPQFPKIQYPSRRACPECRNGKEWVRPEVLKFLKRIYATWNLSSYGFKKTP